MSDSCAKGDRDRPPAVWILEPIVDHQGEAGARRLLEQARSRAQAFSAELSGRVAELEASALIDAVSEVTQIRELLWRAGGYGRMRGFADSADATATALRGHTETTQAEVDGLLLFFELEWVALADEHVELLLAGADGRLDFAVHHLRRLRAGRRHLLPSDQERILAETSVQRLSAWKRLYSETVARLTAELDGETVPMTEALSRWRSPDRGQRQRAMAAVANGATTGLSVRVAAYNQVLGEKAVDDRLRRYPTWLSSRNLTNETTDSAVQTQLATIDARRDLSRRWNRLKARLLGVERLATSDLRAPLHGATRLVPFSESRELITSAWSSFSPRAGAIVDAFFTEGRVDASIRANKQGGALCAQAGTSHSAYVLVNYASRPQDTIALAHELGHGLHFELARSQGALQCKTSIPMAEVASTFSETLVAQRVMADTGDDHERLALSAARLDDAMSSVFETSAVMAAEARMHEHRREHGELSADELSDIYTTSLGELWQDTVEIEDGRRLLWSLMPHMIAVPGYLYSYSYGVLTAWAAFARYGQLGDALAEDYLAMLAAGGSRSPEQLVAMIGLDANDPDFWDAGLDQLDDMLDHTEALAGTLQSADR